MFAEEEKILSYRNVPVNVAADYLGVSLEFIRTGIETEKLPIGVCVKMSGTRRKFLISPERLIAFRHGKEISVPAFRWYETTGRTDPYPGPRSYPFTFG